MTGRAMGINRACGLVGVSQSPCAAVPDHLFATIDMYQEL